MRPRDLLNRRKKVCFLIAGISFFAMAIVAFSVDYLPSSLYKTLSIGTVTVFVVGVFYTYAGIKCPKCNKILGLKFVYAEETLSHCPRCGINFDEDSL
jgi:peptide subunit release factor 1 (eRF1)